MWVQGLHAVCRCSEQLFSVGIRHMQQCALTVQVVMPPWRRSHLCGADVQVEGQPAGRQDGQVRRLRRRLTHPRHLR